MCVCLCVCVCLYVCVCACMCECMCVSQAHWIIMVTSHIGVPVELVYLCEALAKQVQLVTVGTDKFNQLFAQTRPTI